METKETLEKFFQDFGCKVKKLKIEKNRQGSRYAFVWFNDEKSFNSVLDAGKNNGLFLNNNEMYVNEAKDNKEIT